MDTSTYDTFQRFAWTVPRAFADALNACHFSRGDTLYSFANPYREWDKSFTSENLDKKYIIIKNPESKPILGSSEGFEENWNASAEVEIHTIGRADVEAIRTTQGRIYTLLHTNDWNVLKIDSPAPTIPLTPRKLLKLLAIPPSAKNKKSEGETPDFVVRRKAFQGNLVKLVSHKSNDANCFFAFPYDPCNELLRNKHSKLTTGFRNLSDSCFIVLSEDDYSLLELTDLLPTLELRVITFPTDKEVVHNHLKEILYSPQQDKKVKVERFRISAHGFFHSLGC